jgi:hypothetical protein
MLFTFLWFMGWSTAMRREDRLGAVCGYKGGGAAETETWVFVPNETLLNPSLQWNFDVNIRPPPPSGAIRGLALFVMEFGHK